MSEVHSSKKVCGRCEKPLDRSAFGKDKQARDGLRANCKACRKELNHDYHAGLSRDEKDKRLERTRQWRLNFPEKYKASYQQGNRKDKYGIDEATYQAMLTAQEGKCAICRQAETVRSNGTDVNRLAVDHDHTTGAIRQLLCSKCNGGLGFFRDDPALLEAALSYLKKHKPVA